MAAVSTAAAAAVAVVAAVVFCSIFVTIAETICCLDKYHNIYVLHKGYLRPEVSIV